MHVAELVENIPTVRGDSTLLEAARTLVRYRLTALVVLGEDGQPSRVLPSTQVMWALIPQYMRHDEALAHVLDEAGADESALRLRDRTVQQLLDDDDEVTARDLPRIAPDDTLVEAAMVFARTRSPVVLVTGRDGTFHGVVTVSRLMAAAVALAGEESDPDVQRRLSQDLLDVDGTDGIDGVDDADGEPAR